MTKPSDMQFSVGQQWVAESLDGPWYPADSDEGRRILEARKLVKPVGRVAAVDETRGIVTIVGCGDE
jgi:hypothetical protein